MKNKLNISKASITIISANVFLVMVVLLAVIYGFKNAQYVNETSGSNVNILLFIAILIVGVNSFTVIHDRYSLKRAEDRYEVLNNTIAQIETLNNTLRAQRHDFLNQLQVIYSLLEMNEYLEAKNYIENVYLDIQKVSKFLKTSSPAINALLQAKLLTCEKEGIDFEITVSSQLFDLKIPAWEMCRVLGNLIDNSIYALKEKENNKKISVEIYQDLKAVGFKVTNSGPVIEKANLEKIFMPGFTTKGVHGEGMGLSIVKDIIDSANGTIDVLSAPDKTEFEIKIPR